MCIFSKIWSDEVYDLAIQDYVLVYLEVSEYTIELIRVGTRWFSKVIQQSGAHYRSISYL